MTYYLKKMGHQELGSIKEEGGRPTRGRYIYISKDERVLSLFPPLSKHVLNDSSLLPIIPLYAQEKEKIYCNYIYHNDKYNGSVAKSPRDEYRIYLNSALEMGELYFRTGDILVLKPSFIDVQTSSSSKESLSQKIYFADRISVADGDLYRKYDKIIEDSPIKRGHAVHNSLLLEIETKIRNIMQSEAHLQTVVDHSVTQKIELTKSSVSEMFTASSFRDFVMVGYENKCAVTGTVIEHGNFSNLEAAHIHPKSHGGLFFPNNGIALTRDIHWSFDKGFFTLNDDYTIKVHEKIKSPFLKIYDGKSINVPRNNFFKPNIQSIEYHRENVYGLFLSSGRL